MRLIDAHTHAWGADTAELPWRADVLPPGWNGAYTHADLIADMDRVGVDQSVIVTTPLYGRGERANEYTMRSIEAHPDRLYGVGLVDFFGDEAAVRRRLRRVTGHPRMLGVRMHAALAYEPIPTDLDRTGEWILDDRLEPVWDEVASLDAHVYVFPKGEQLSMIERLAADRPDVTFVVDHMAWPDETTSPDEAPWTDFADIAEHDNVWVKVSSLPRSAESGWPYEDLHEYVRRLLEWFGAERLLAGSDYPWMDDWASYEDCLSWLEAAPFLSARDRAFLSYRTFERLRG
ncbi:amidohydrolase family protein [Halopelagius longus]|uniref:Amidohydrolase n=1 Tax=Halopelagius longus TaxID=1236180 RepID=A0A1H1FBD6_9EURY|nr:amidohydrolase family protein [Halopelagius longus]RDI70176.1 amidohydrolase [Halopelagius longus]SDQ98423.1 L-fuconolactonase [Halopelagius longus]